MKQSGSSRRTNERAREVIANILLFDIADPRLSLATITGCEVSFDKSVCNVFYSTSPDCYEETAEAFEGARGRIRSLMARRLSWRIAPELRFMLDESVDEAERIGRALLRERERMGDAVEGEGASDAEAPLGADAPGEPLEGAASSQGGGEGGRL